MMPEQANLDFEGKQTYLTEIREKLETENIEPELRSAIFEILADKINSRPGQEIIINEATICRIINAYVTAMGNLASDPNFKDSGYKEKAVKVEEVLGRLNLKMETKSSAQRAAKEKKTENAQVAGKEKIDSAPAGKEDKNFGWMKDWEEKNQL